MQASTVDTPTAGHYGTIFVTIELSQKTWLVTLHSPDRDRISRHKLEGGDHAGLLMLIERMRERAARTLGAVPAVVSCYEAGYDGFGCTGFCWPQESRTTSLTPPALRWISGRGG